MVLTIAVGGVLYAKWALYGHIGAGALLVVSSLIIAPPVLLEMARAGMSDRAFWTIVVLLECAYVFGLWSACRWAIRRGRSTEPVPHHHLQRGRGDA